MNPKISVIVPIYNVEPYLCKCIDSILSQTFTDFELILVNDGSPDNCGAICDDYAKIDTRIKVIHKENGGLGSARNAGIKIAKGQYIGIIDSDDYIDEKMYEILYHNAKTHSSDVVVCDVVKVDVESQAVLKQGGKTEYSIEHFTNIQALNQLYQPNEDMFDTMGRRGEKWIFAVNKLYKRSLFDALKYPEGVIYDDEFIIHKIYYQSTRVTSISVELYYYVQRPDSISHSSFSIKKFDRVYALKERVDFFKIIRQNKLHEKAFKVYLEVFIWSYLAARSQLTGVNKDLKQLKRTLNRSIESLMKNPYSNWKQKVMVGLFIISPSVYVYVTNAKRGRSLRAT
ncbi:glycosyltransferase family 2 protein [Neobacillus vireti]|uniref:Glycosyl transferase family protein n=1 Tax=Neobacillus vireti LMG 21834 TaxID=1131730 RepID=A0AB94IKJ3_9BACI|nr:glycosyltransferase family 2 protein [Neobacillus vireti]ETI67554.1 glycosyl transferase family protein [Neobacillus vireti LMG 21834]